MKKTNLFVTVTLLFINVVLLICNYKIHKTLSVYERGEQARISVDAAREVNDSTNDTVKIINLQGQGRQICGIRQSRNRNIFKLAETSCTEER